MKKKKTFRRQTCTLNQFSNKQRSGDIKKTEDMILDKQKILDFHKELGWSSEDIHEIAELNAKAQLHIDQYQIKGAKQILNKIIRKYPNFLPAWNNLSLMYWISNQLDKAIETAQHVLRKEPNNIHAITNLIHFLIISGQKDKAKAYGVKLKASIFCYSNLILKILEGLSCLGDDEGALDFFSKVITENIDELPKAEMVYHLGAVAASRLGKKVEARKYWKTALRISPNFSLAKDNIADLRKPVSERQGPWPFPFDYWIPLETLSAMTQFLIDQNEYQSDSGFSDASILHLLHRYPECINCVPVLLERGDERGRQYALHVASIVKTQELFKAIKNFALDIWGTDKDRVEAARIVKDAGVLPTGLIRMWIQGVWQDFQISKIKIHGEPIQDHSPEVQKLSQQALAELRKNNPDYAEQLLKKALKMEPDKPDLLNNLANAYHMQGHIQQGIDLVHKIHKRHPDYLFARTGLAQWYSKIGNIEKARDILKPVLQRKRFHYSEFDALLEAQINICIANGDMNSAHSLLDTWESVNPKSTRLPYYKRIVDK